MARLMTHPSVFPDSAARIRVRRRRRGAIIVLLGPLLIAFLAAAAFSIDVAYMHLINAQLRAATDAAAKSAASTLSRTLSLDEARAAGIQTAAANRVGGRSLVLRPSDIVFGRGQVQADGSVLFQPNQTPYGAAKVSFNLSASSSPNAPVNLFFGGFLGKGLFETTQTAVATQLDREIALVVDRSGSMQGQKLTNLKAAVAVFLSTLGQSPKDEPVGLACYNHSASILRQLTTNYTLIANSMNSLTATGTTSIGAGIIKGREILNAGSSSLFIEKTIILMTDGCHNTSPAPLPQAQAAAAQHMVIHTITFGSDADKTLMKQVAQTTGGLHYHAPTGDDLINCYRLIALTLKTVLTD